MIENPLHPTPKTPSPEVQKGAIRTTKTLHLRAQIHHFPCKSVTPKPVTFASKIRDDGGTSMIESAGPAEGPSTAHHVPYEGSMRLRPGALHSELWAFLGRFGDQKPSPSNTQKGANRTAKTAHLSAQNHHFPYKSVTPIPVTFTSHIRDLLPTYP